VKRVLILGSTGSIGVQALQVIANSTDLTVVGLSCGSRVGLLMEQATSLGVADVALADPAAAESLSSALYPELRVRVGTDAAARLVREVDADLVLNAIVGFAGLEATLATLALGTPLALANKESLVSGGRVVTDLAGRNGVPIIPVDSEHSALFQLLAGEERRAVRSLVVTASGGPFRGRTAADLAAITPEDALAHPTWTMGPKITIDSATLMNKGLEVIEAHHLFGVPYEDIEVVVHPQSLVHALVRLVDGALLAHVGMPDMRVPIAYALFHPERRPLGAEGLDLAGTALEFASPDLATFRCLSLAREAGRAGDAATCALNAANEVAVRGFLDRRLPFLGIPSVVEDVLDQLDSRQPSTYDEIVSLDSWARGAATELVRRHGSRA
jgi:1-deoxy-D-xylulose-5-phosphate reductoisomerase